MMPHYDFSSLSPYDFENLTRDLLQKELSIRLESFKMGRDGGIDLRYAPVPGNNLIVQCKHFVGSGFRKLFHHLDKDETPKVKKLSPSRYILATSVPLLPQQKDAMHGLLSPYCQSVGDIFGNEDLNNLLGKYPEIEKKHFKLWLTSSALLEKIIHSNVFNQTAIDMELIKKKMKVYVQNESFFDALKIMEELNYCLIVGIPGIGKTTLAEILLWAHADLGYEIIKITSDIEEAYKVHEPAKRQLFYYDDFLGQTSLENKFNKNEEQNFLRFIDWVRDSKSTKFIMTTREYILNQAKAIYEIISRSAFDARKCVIDLEKYTKLDRAKILFNHVYFSSLPTEYKQTLLHEKAYMKIINHRNFNPRIIEWMADYSRKLSPSSRTFVQDFLNNLDRPIDLWIHAFERQLSQFSRDLLMVLSVLPAEVLLEDMQKAFSSLYELKAKKYNSKTAPQDFYRALKELDGSFIAIGKTGSNTTVKFNNPSIKDFVEEYICSDTTILKELYDAFEFFDQFVRIFEISQKTCLRMEERKNILATYEELMKRAENSLHFPDARLISVTYSDHRKAKVKWPIPTEERLKHIINSVEVTPTAAGERMLQVCVDEFVNDVKNGKADKSHLVSLLADLSKTKVNINLMLDEVIQNGKKIIMTKPASLDDFEIIDDFKATFNDHLTAEELNSLAAQFEEYLDRKTDEWVENDPNSMLHVAETLEQVGNSFNVNVHERVKDIRSQAAEAQQEEGAAEDDDYDQWKESMYDAHAAEKDMDEKIDSLFEILAESESLDEVL